MILKNLFRRKGRTLLAVLGISIGMAAIIGLGALTAGLRAGYGSVMTGSGADLVVKDADAVDLLVSAIDEDVGPRLGTMPEVAAVSPMIQGVVQSESSLYFFVFGYPEGSFALDRIHVIEGFPLYSQQADQMHGTPILLGSAAAEAYSAEVGSTLRIGENVYRVAGIYETGEAFEDGGAVMRLTDAQMLLGMQRRVSAYYIQINDPGMADRLITRVERLYPDLMLSSATDMASENNLTNVLGIMVSVVGGLALLIGGAAMTNAQLMAVLERTREIGLLRAVGWSGVRVMLMILGESILIGVLGGIVGTGIAWIMLAMYKDTLSAFGATTTIPLELLLRALGIVFVLGTVGGLYPAIRASRLPPIEALRYEGGTMGDKAARLPIGGMAVQNLWRRKQRTALTLVEIGITIGAILTLDTMLGSVDGLIGSLFGGSEIAVREADVANLILSVVDERMGDRLAAMPEVKSVSGILVSPTLSRQTGVFVIQGYAPREEAILTFNMVEGERISGSREIMLGRQMAETQHLSVGDTMTLSGGRYRIVGIYEHDLAMFEMGGVVSLRDAQNMTRHPGKVTFYSISLNDPMQAQQVVDKINAQFPEVHASLTGRFASESPNIQSANLLSNGISILAVLVGGVGLMNTMLMSTLERTREIGVLRALGWRRRAVLGLIVRESLALGLLGGLAGCIISLVMVTMIRTVALNTDAVRIIWSIENVIRALVVAVLLALVGGFYPALRATRLQPVEALRYE
jgi:putative ABC transport system permease protein